MDFTESKGCSELLDWAATFCSLERSDAEDQNKVLGMQNPVYRAPTRAAINLSLPWHSSAVEMVDRNFNIVTGKSLNLAKSRGPKDFFSGIGYNTHNLECSVPKPESLVIPLRSPPAERTVEDQPLYLVLRHPDDSNVRVDLASGSF